MQTQTNNNEPQTATVEGIVEAVVPKTLANGQRRTDYLVRRADGSALWINAAGDGNISGADYPAGIRVRVRVVRNVSDHPQFGHRIFTNAYERPVKITEDGTPIPELRDADLTPDKPAGQLLALAVEALRRIADRLDAVPPPELFEVPAQAEGAR